jgi:hypothetical protein
MSARTTRADLDHAFAAMVRAAQAIGLDTTNLGLELGSVTYGRAWRLYRRDPAHGGQSRWYGLDYLGSTAREAERALRAAAGAFVAVADHADGLR